MCQRHVHTPAAWMRCQQVCFVARLCVYYEIVLFRPLLLKTFEGQLSPGQLLQRRMPLATHRRAPMWILWYLRYRQPTSPPRNAMATPPEPGRSASCASPRPQQQPRGILSSPTKPGYPAIDGEDPSASCLALQYKWVDVRPRPSHEPRRKAKGRREGQTSVTRMFQQINNR